MADQNQTANTDTLDPKKLEQIEELLDDLKARAGAAHKAGDTYMLSVYNQIVKVVSPIVVSAQGRVDRESKAVLNKAEKALKKKDREAKEHAKKTASS